MEQKYSSANIAGLSLIATLGLLSVIRCTLALTNSFSLPLLAVLIAEILGYTWLFMYLMDKDMKSKTFFITILISLCFILLLVEIIQPFPLPSPFNLICLILAFLTLAGIIAILFGWRNHTLSRLSAITVSLCYIAHATIQTVFFFKEPATGEAILNGISNIWGGPILGIAVMATFLIRMSRKRRGL